MRRNFGGAAAIDGVSHAKRNLVQFVEHIELGHDQPGDTVNHASVTQQWQIQPATAPGTSRHRAIFIATRPQQVAGGIQRFGGEGAATYTRAVRLGDADDAVDCVRRNTGANGGTTGSSAGRSDEGISSVVDVEHGALRPFKHDGFAFR